MAIPFARLVYFFLYIFIIDWTAPLEGIGDIRFYAAGNVVDGNGGSSGDNGIFLETPIILKESTVSNVADESDLSLSMKVLTNPIREQIDLLLKGANPGFYQLRLFSLSGQQITAKKLEVRNGEQRLSLHVGELNRGPYILSLSNGQQQVSRKVLKL